MVPWRWKNFVLAFDVARSHSFPAHANLHCQLPHVNGHHFWECANRRNDMPT
jgi:hypothetical protein